MFNHDISCTSTHYIKIQESCAYGEIINNTQQTICSQTHTYYTPAIKTWWTVQQNL